MLTNNEEKLPEVGKYNAGQKVVFWAMSVLIIVLIGSGLVIWDRYFSEFTTIEQKRIAVFVHSVAAVDDHLRLDRACLCRDLGARHVPGDDCAGKVTGGWAWRHHRKWLRELVGRRADDKAAPAE